MIDRCKVRRSDVSWAVARAALLAGPLFLIWAVVVEPGSLGDFRIGPAIFVYFLLASIFGYLPAAIPGYFLGHLLATPAVRDPAGIGLNPLIWPLTGAVFAGLIAHWIAGTADLTAVFAMTGASYAMLVHHMLDREGWHR